MPSKYRNTNTSKASRPKTTGSRRVSTTRSTRDVKPPRPARTTTQAKKDFNRPASTSSGRRVNIHTRMRKE